MASFLRERAANWPRGSRWFLARLLVTLLTGNHSDGVRCDWSFRSRLNPFLQAGEQLQVAGPLSLLYSIPEQRPLSGAMMQWMAEHVGVGCAPAGAVHSVLGYILHHYHDSSVLCDLEPWHVVLGYQPLGTC